ncbi:MAG: transposase, partial [Cyanobacteria bacterium P01_E01_bin.6]
MKREYTQFCQSIAEQYAGAKKIRPVQDNLNTHNSSSFYEHLPVEDAFALSQRVEFFYTPKSASWLNMIEIEFSAVARGCLHRRIPTIEELERDVLALVAEKHEKRININWQLLIDKARHKFSRHYRQINPDKYLDVIKIK